MRTVALAGLVAAASACAPARPPAVGHGGGSAVNHVPQARARCAPCTVAPGGALSLSVEADDVDGDSLQVVWAAPSGTLESPTSPASRFTAPARPGPVPIVVTVRDGRGGIASDTITITVAAPPA